MVHISSSDLNANICASIGRSFPNIISAFICGQRILIVYWTVCLNTRILIAVSNVFVSRMRIVVAGITGRTAAGCLRKRVLRNEMSCKMSSLKYGVLYRVKKKQSSLYLLR